MLCRSAKDNGFCLNFGLTDLVCCLFSCFSMIKYSVYLVLTQVLCGLSKSSNKKTTLRLSAFHSQILTRKPNEALTLYFNFVVRVNML